METKEVKKCLACQKEITNKWKRSFCKDKCQIEYNSYKKGKKKKEEMFIDLRGKRKYSIMPKANCINERKKKGEGISKVVLV